MITSNAKKILSGIFAFSNSTAFIPIKLINGSNVYCANVSGNNASWPAGSSHSISFSASGSGIKVGSGTTPASESDYNLESVITSGLSGSVSSQRGMDSNENAYIQFLVTLTNTSDSDIAISEIGFIQTVRTSTTNGSTASTNNSALMDRTVLDSPLTIPASASATITYTLKGIWNEDS